MCSRVSRGRGHRCPRASPYARLREGIGASRPAPPRTGVPRPGPTGVGIPEDHEEGLPGGDEALGHSPRGDVVHVGGENRAERSIGRPSQIGYSCAGTDRGCRSRCQSADHRIGTNRPHERAERWRGERLDDRRLGQERCEARPCADQDQLAVTRSGRRSTRAVATYPPLE